MLRSLRQEAPCRLPRSRCGCAKAASFSWRAAIRQVGRSPSAGQEASSLSLPLLVAGRPAVTDVEFHGQTCAANDGSLVVLASSESVRPGYNRLQHNLVNLIIGLLALA